LRDGKNDLMMSLGRLFSWRIRSEKGLGCCRRTSGRRLYILLIRANCIPYRALTRRGLFPSHQETGATMSDIIFGILALALFAASIGYAYACERL
jgi:hypothetical protein